MKKTVLALKSLVALFALLLPAAASAASADLTISAHSHSPTMVEENSYLTYSFTIHNNSATDAASSTTITIKGTGNQFFDSGSPFFFTNNGDNTFTATVGTVAPGADVVVTAKYFVQSGAVSLTATVASPDDPNPDNNSATDSATTASQPTADLEMTMVTVAPNPGQVGDLRTYQGTLTNLGPDTATNVAVAIQADSIDGQGFGYDAFETFDHSIPPPSSPDPDANGYRYLPVGNIPSGGKVTFFAYYRAVAEGTFSRNYFTSLSGDEIDPNLNNNNFAVFSTIGAAQGAQADLDPTVQASSAVTVGSTITYTFNTFNLGPDAATNAMTTFKPSANESFVSASVPYTVEKGGPSDGYYLVDDGDLPLHVGHTFTFVFKATAAGPITLTGSAYSDVYDPNGTNDNFSATTTATSAPPPPPHGGLTATSFTVNGSRDASSGLADTVLRFAAAQLGTPAGLTVQVQYTTVPNDPDAIWTPLNNGNAGLMTYDPTSQQFLLSSLNYPTQKTVAFRAVAKAPGYSDSISNMVGNFDLTSTKPRLDVPALAVTGNGPFADLYFRTYSGAILGGTSERLQVTTTPFDEISWANLNNGNGGTMLPTTDPKRFYLMANQVPTGQNIFFRVIASKSGYADGISEPNGPYTITADTPPTVTALTISPKGTGTGIDVDHPIVLSAGTVTINATVKPGTGRAINTLKLLVDADTKFSVDGKTTLQYITSTLSVGDHVIEAVGVDDLKAQARLGTNPVYVRIIPPVTATTAETTAGGTTVAALSAGKVFTVAKSGGDWNDPTTWKDASGKSGVPGQNDVAVLGSSTVGIKGGSGGNPPETAYAGAFTINGGRLTGAGSLIVFKQATIAAATLEGVALSVAQGATCEFINTENIQFPAVSGLPPGQIINSGTCKFHGAAGVIGISSFTNLGSIVFAPPLTLPGLAGMDPSADTRQLGTGLMSNTGVMTSGLIGQDGNGLIGQDGNGLIGQDGNGIISQDGNSLVGPSGGTLVNTNGSNIVGQGGGNLVNTNGSNIVGQGGGNIVAQGGLNGPARENVHGETAVSTGFVQSGGETDLSGIIITGDVTLDGGVLAGSGYIYGNLTNNGGYILPGHSAGMVAVQGDFTQGANGTLVLEDGGAAPGQFDQLQVSGKATLGGTLDLNLINGYTPDKADTFSPLAYSSHTGSFAAVSGNATATVNGTGLLTTVNPALPAPASGDAVNISTRAKVLSSDNVEIGGFIVTGPAGSTKQVIVRGLGPSLASAGVPGALADPYLEVYSGGTQIATNDNWKENQSKVMQTGLAPTNDLESAIVATLAPGAYTVVLHGAHGETGVGLLEVYDLDASSAATLANISTRCKVQAGDDVMIGGFILQGGEPAKVLVRGIGPSLVDAGLTGVLADPVLELHDANGAVITNNDWRETQEADIIATTIPPTKDKEAAIVVTLAPGQYTAVLRGNNDGTGVGLVEVYNLK